VRAWAVPVSDGRGRLSLWVGVAASKNRDVIEERFRKLTEAIRERLGPQQAPAVNHQAVHANS
jgi:hypothetical protein